MSTLSEIPLPGVYIVRIGNELHEFKDYDDIPDKFDNLIKFTPYIIDDVQAYKTEVGKYAHEKLHELLTRETR